MTRTTADYETVIAGAGPAGVMAATRAAKGGRVLLIDSSSLPREKSCGGMLNEHAQEFLSSFGDLPEQIILGPKHVNFRYWDWDRDIRKPTSLRFLNVDRKGFDEWLLSLLPDNVEVLGSLQVQDFAADPQGVIVTLKNGGAPECVSCRTLIGADGARSTVRRALGVGSVSTYVTLQDFVKLEGELDPYFDCIYMRDIGDSHAYSYVVPKGDEAIVGSVFYPHTRRPHEKQEMTLEILRKRLPQLGERIRREASVALYVRDKHDVVPGRGPVLLAGEAGGFMSPTSGEGISYAMKSGVWAGEAVASSSPQEALAQYTRSAATMTANVRRKLRWLPFMESRTGKYLAGYVPTSIVSRVTEGL